MRPLLPLVVLSMLLPACRPRIQTPELAAEGCLQEVSDTFGPPQTAVIALRAADGGVLWRPDVLAAVDRVCTAFEDESVDDWLAVKCVTNVPLMELGRTTAKVKVIHDELPFDEDTARRFKAQLLTMEFARGDVIDPTGERTTYIHLPMASFEGVDIRGVFEAQAGREVSVLQMAIDRADPSELGAYRRLARQGPSSSVIAGMFDAGEDGALKDPAILLALQAFQVAAEGLPRVTQTFTIADDLTMARRGLHKGNPAEAFIPNKRAEIAQLLLALSLNPAASSLGPRIDHSERVALIRVHVIPSTPEQVERTRERLEELLRSMLPPRASGIFCSQ
jgi:hypothetical protein